MEHKPAFPKLFQEVQLGNGYIPGQEGMSLREYYAGQALMGWIAHYGFEQGTPEAGAKFCIERVDALLAELNKTKEG